MSGAVLSTVNRAPLMELGRVISSSDTRVLIGIRTLGINKSVGAHATCGVILSTRTRKLLGPSSVVMRPADNGRNVNLSLITTMHKCGTIVVVPSSMDRRHHVLVHRCNTRIVLIRSRNGVNSTVTGYVTLTGRVTTSGPGIFIPRRFSGPTGPTTRHRRATLRVVRRTTGPVRNFYSNVKANKALSNVKRILGTRGPSVHV